MAIGWKRAMTGVAVGAAMLMPSEAWAQYPNPGNPPTLLENAPVPPDGVGGVAALQEPSRDVSASAAPGAVVQPGSTERPAAVESAPTLPLTGGDIAGLVGIALTALTAGGVALRYSRRPTA